MIGSLRPAIGLFNISLVGGRRTFTLPSLLGFFLHQLEERYGDRDKTYTPLGIEFADDGPMVWFPGPGRFISIMLSADAAHEPNRAVWQLAHESVHLLAPNGGGPALVVEEGLAVLFADEVAAKHSFDFQQNDPAYIEAAALTGAWLRQFPLAICRIREKQPSFQRWSPDLLLSFCENMSAELAFLLCQPLKR